jgi:hypothetical protein
MRELFWPCKMIAINKEMKAHPEKLEATPEQMVNVAAHQEDTNRVMHEEQGLIQGLAWGCNVPRMAEETDPGRLWFLEGFGRCLWVIVRPCCFCTAQRTQLSGTRQEQCCMRNPENGS